MNNIRFLFNDGEYDTSVFPGGEVHVRIKSVFMSARLCAYLRSSEDIIRLIMLCDAIKRTGAKIGLLRIPYLPYARQDRVCNPGEAHSLRVICDLINGIGAERVEVYDIHSDVSLALLNNVVNLSAEYLGVDQVIGDKLVICPDAGAEKRILKLKKPYVMATKVRDVATGDIIETKLYGDVSGRECIIVDDICDGGRTFIELAKVLKVAGAASVDLYVTHGLFTKGMDVFTGLIDSIYCCDPFTGTINKCS